MSARRAVALGVAVAMIVASIAVRVFVIDSARSDAKPSAHVVCVTELAPVCSALARGSDRHIDITVEPAGDTARKLVAATDSRSAALDGWLTLAPWPQIVDARRAAARRPPLFRGTPARLARSPLVLAVRTEDVARLRARCHGALTWRCIGELAGPAVVPAHPEPLESATGLLVLGQAVAQDLASRARPAPALTAADWSTNRAFRAWFTRLETHVPVTAFAAGGDPFATWVASHLSTYTVVGGLESEIASELAHAAAGTPAVSVEYPAAMASADVEFAPLVGGDDATLAVTRAATADALVRSGWRVAGRPLPTSVPRRAPALPAGNGLPPATALDALQTLWRATVR